MLGSRRYLSHVLYDFMYRYERQAARACLRWLATPYNNNTNHSQKGGPHMKLFHISDLHFGKLLHFYNLKESQQQVLTQIIERANEYQPDAIVIAGDIYDKSVPSAEAGALYDEFLNQLSHMTPQIPVLIIAGNHDNATRLNFASSFFEREKIYVSVMPPQSEDEYLKKVVLQDEFGDVNFYLLPFTKPG